MTHAWTVRALAALLALAPAAARAEATLSITTKPSHADVTIDGTASGQTPLRLSTLAPGKHRVFLDKAGYRTNYQVVTLVDGKTTKVNVSMVRKTRLPPAAVQQTRRGVADAMDLSSGLVGLVFSLPAYEPSGGAPGHEAPRTYDRLSGYWVAEGKKLAGESLRLLYFVDETSRDQAGTIIEKQLSASRTQRFVRFNAGPLAGDRWTPIFEAKSDTVVLVTGDFVINELSRPFISINARAPLTLRYEGADHSGPYTVAGRVESRVTRFSKPKVAPISASRDAEGNETLTVVGSVLVEVNFNADDSGTGYVMDGLRNVLGTIAWTADGDVMVTIFSGPNPTTFNFNYHTDN